MAEFLKHFTRKKAIDVDSLTRTELSRCLTVVDLTALGIGSTLGAGIYVVAAEVAKNIAGPGVVLSFLIAAVASVLSALCYAEFGARVPKAGSAYVYSYVTVGELCAFIIGWNLLLEYMIGAASVGRAWSSYFDSLIHDKIRLFTLQHVGEMNAPLIGKYPDFFAFFLVLFVTCILAVGVKKSSIFNTVCTFVNLLVILFVTIVGLCYAQTKNWTDDFLPYGFGGVLAGSATCFYAFVGFDIIATSGEEAINPSRTIPLSIIIALGICFVAYAGVSSALTLMVPYSSLLGEAALPNAFSQRGLYWAKFIIATGALTGLSASLLGSLFPLPRLLFSMGADGLIFRFLAIVNHRTDVPVYATLIAGFITAVLAMVFELQELVEMMSIGTLQAYTIVAICVLILRYQPGSIGLVSESDQETSEVEPTDESTSLRKCSTLTAEPTEASGNRVSKATLVIIVILFADAGFLIKGYDALTHAHGWAVALACLLSIITVIPIVVIARQPQSRIHIPFKVPWVPTIPLLSIYINIYLMLKLQYLTWIRFAVWLVLGLMIYLFYGVRHSSENSSSPSKPDNTGEYVALKEPGADEGGGGGVRGASYAGED